MMMMAIANCDGDAFVWSNFQSFASLVCCTQKVIFWKYDDDDADDDDNDNGDDDDRITLHHFNDTVNQTLPPSTYSRLLKAEQY